MSKVSRRTRVEIHHVHARMPPGTASGACFAPCRTREQSVRTVAIHKITANRHAAKTCGSGLQTVPTALWLTDYFQSFDPRASALTAGHYSLIASMSRLASGQVRK
jgi:hypothetical protein